MSRLRLAAACALLKLAQEPCYHEIITLEQYQLCALVINVRTAIFNLPALHFQLKSFSVQLIFTPPLPLLPDIVPFHPPHHFLFSVSSSLRYRMSATRCDSVLPRSFTGACAVCGYRWNTWQCSLCAPRTPLRRGGLTLASAWWKTSTYAASTSNSTLPSAVKKPNDIWWFRMTFEGWCHIHCVCTHRQAVLSAAGVCGALHHPPSGTRPGLCQSTRHRAAKGN